MGYISDGAVRTFNRWMLGMPQPRRNTTRTFTYTVTVTSTDTHDNAAERMEATLRRCIHREIEPTACEVEPTTYHHQG